MNKKQRLVIATRPDNRPRKVHTTQRTQRRQPIVFATLTLISTNKDRASVKTEALFFAIEPKGIRNRRQETL
jgi:hypothetical protein